MKTLTEIMGLDNVPQVVFEKAPLVLTLYQIRFNTELGIADDAFVAPFQKAIQAEYPHLETRKRVVRALDTSKEGEFGVEKRRRLLRKFSDTEGKWALVLSENSLTVETWAYQNIGHFIERLNTVLNALAKHIAPPFVSGLALRYIDELRSSEMDWAAIVRPELLGLLAVPDLSVQTEVSLQELRLRDEDRKAVILRYGLIPGGSMFKSRAKMKDPFFVLDYEVSQTFPVDQALAVEPEIICRLAEEYNDLLYKLFRWSISEQYTQTLGGQKND